MPARDKHSSLFRKLSGFVLILSEPETLMGRLLKFELIQWCVVLHPGGGAGLPILI